MHLFHARTVRPHGTVSEGNVVGNAQWARRTSTTSLFLLPATGEGCAGGARQVVVGRSRSAEERKEARRGQAKESNRGLVAQLHVDVTMDALADPALHWHCHFVAYGFTATA